MMQILKSIIKRNRRQCSHGEMIERLLKERELFFQENPVFVEIGCGLSTVSLSKMAKEMSAISYSIDYNSDKSADLKLRFGKQVNNTNFIIGDSLERLPKIVEKHKIDFLFLDSAASAMHTFKEFSICESAFNIGACLLVDNAALPGKKKILSAVRKGKILVPYLLASSYWEVFSHHRAGDSMISAILHDKADFADYDYEHPEYIDEWRQYFNKSLK